MKRLIDISFAGLALIVLCPIILGVGILVRVCMGPPVLFRQERPGRYGQPFDLIKFRTMHSLSESGEGTSLDGARLTSLGRTLRATSLDELPQLWNVLKGDMSLVGPRPLLMEYLSLYSPEQARRHEVKPGITGWAQVNGRNAISWDEKFALDVWYVDHQSLWLDLKIMGLTVLKVINRHGISATGQATTTKFERRDEE